MVRLKYVEVEDVTFLMSPDMRPIGRAHPFSVTLIDFNACVANSEIFSHGKSESERELKDRSVHSISKKSEELQASNIIIR